MKHRLNVCFDLVNVPSPEAGSDDTPGVRIDDHCSLGSEKVVSTDGNMSWRGCMNFLDRMEQVLLLFPDRALFAQELWFC